MHCALNICFCFAGFSRGFMKSKERLALSSHKRRELMNTTNLLDRALLRLHGKEGLVIGFSRGFMKSKERLALLFHKRRELMNTTNLLDRA
ncbi:hypothetical protein Sjap_005062 [Stephania japonica]|uniref:Uncharacterized protein n=1 Tax=Stephania japonica TaxID=461633 RepID=A0AAP0K4N7_9MAGN